MSEEALPLFLDEYEFLDDHDTAYLDVYVNNSNTLDMSTNSIINNSVVSEITLTDDNFSTNSSLAPNKKHKSWVWNYF